MEILYASYKDDTCAHDGHVTQICFPRRQILNNHSHFLFIYLFFKLQPVYLMSKLTFKLTK